MLVPLGGLLLRGEDRNLELLGNRRELLGHYQERSLPERGTHSKRQNSHNTANAWIHPCLKPETQEVTVPQAINPSFCVNLSRFLLPSTNRSKSAELQEQTVPQPPKDYKPHHLPPCISQQNSTCSKCLKNDGLREALLRSLTF